jgi:cytochrome c553
VRGVPACQSCHGERLTGVQPNVPGLIGLPRVYIASQLGTWQAGTRRAAAPGCMRDIAQRMTGLDVQAVATRLAAHPVPVDTAPPMECGSVSLPER